MAEQGSGGNVVAALCSFFLPGLGQLVQGWVWAALGFFLTAILIGIPLWFFLLGWIINIWSTVDAALWKPRR